MLMPLLSEADPAESAEGSIDPLGMYPIADALASRMVPGVQERPYLKGAWTFVFTASIGFWRRR